MSSKRSLYKSPRWKEASESQKNMSQYQRKVNHLHKAIKKKMITIRARKLQALLWSRLFNKLTNEGRVSKEESYPYLLSLKDAEEVVRKVSSEIPSVRVADEVIKERIAKHG